MTMPQLQNCKHSPDGWCLACVKELWYSRYMYMKQVERLEADISSCVPSPSRANKISWASAFAQWEKDNANKW